jgi:SAM-dependent methyltransferase
MENTQLNQLIEAWKREEQQPFIGWDFSYLNNRMSEEQAPWSYSTRAADLMDRAASVVDMDTGGGERFLKLKTHWPKKVVATEGYPPNFKLATERLAPLGVNVVEVQLTEDEPMPFDDGEFELVLNRHAAFNPREVARILAPGGTFLTQQVHGLWAQDLLAAFGVKPQWPHATPAYYVPQLEAAGLTMVAVEEWKGHLSFSDVGAIVYYLKAAPWLVPDFSVDTHLPYLFKLQERLEKGNSLTFEARKYLIEAGQEEGIPQVNNEGVEG